ncbi:hypothetical protein JOC85_001755 [Bacillus mesophilus]|uniref:Uncharacterized protein n=1 Tax=Bacillus mesophilus TaxID=1808955 RepID=A0A6M0Q530_9BACI|nr:hypothetical protein [Bacillus mesophilus]MBM7660983.1 hypothetical protein [Bacillus mesophilus]NEY71475.1 hypothetical protein [Bacillus mesophilus]
MFRLVGIFICCFFLLTSTVWGATDPVEVEEIKKNAPVHLIGKVIADELHRDFSDSSGPSQIRVMTLQQEQLLRVSPEVAPLGEYVQVFYSYIPVWQSELYEGGKRVDVTVGDIVEIYLDRGEFGFEPALGGDTIEHIVYMDKRAEPIPEPFLHKLTRETAKLLDTYLSVTVFLGFLLFILVVIFLHKKISI